MVVGLKCKFKAAIFDMKCLDLVPLTLEGFRTFCVCVKIPTIELLFFFISVWPQLQSIVRFLFKNKILHLNAF